MIENIKMERNGIKEIEMTEIETERMLILENLRNVAEKNLSLVNNAKHNLKTNAFIYIIAILIGIVFITFEKINKSSIVSNIVANSLFGLLGGSLLFISLKNILANSKSSSTKKCFTIGPSGIDEKNQKRITIVLSLKSPISDKHLKQTETIIKERNENLRLMRNTISIYDVIGSVILLVFVLFDVLSGFISSRRDYYIYIVSIILVVGGLNSLIRCIIIHFILANPAIFKRRFYAFIAFIYLCLNNLVRYSNDDSDNDYDILEENISLCQNLVLLRVTLVDIEKSNIKRLLYGLEHAGAKKKFGVINEV